MLSVVEHNEPTFAMPMVVPSKSRPVTRCSMARGLVTNGTCPLFFLGGDVVEQVCGVGRRAEEVGRRNVIDSTSNWMLKSLR